MKIKPNLKMLFNYCNLVFQFLIVLLLLCACFSPLDWNKTTLSINLGGDENSNVRSAKPWPPQDHGLLEQLVLNIEITGQGQKQKQTLTNGETNANFNVISGTWNISVEALLGGDIYARGFNSVEVKAGKNNVAIVQMGQWHIVTFEPNNGSAPYKLPVADGGVVTRPKDPIRGVVYIFSDWYLGTDPYNFTSSINSDITLTANWYLVRNIGDIGPGGGIIFYIDENGFTVEGYGNPGDPGYFASYTAHYLEVSQTNMQTDTGLLWGSLNGVLGTEEAIGTGRKNTELILEHDPYPFAALACNIYNGGSITDWFLPSRLELNELYINRSYLNTYLDFPLNASYWSSTQIDNVNAWLFRFDLNLISQVNKQNRYNARAVRAF